MILIPFFKDTQNPNWLKMGVFLCSGGREFWTVDGTDSEISEMLLENGFPVLKIERSGDTVYAEIDASRLKLQNFYLWSEVDHTTATEDVWRIYTIPTSLWTCSIFKEHFWKTSGIQAFSQHLIKY